jgi:uncharacterized protein
MTVSRRAEPERSCVGCRGRAPKPTLLRIARDPAGGADLDVTATAPGRGAYVHRDPACVEAALRKGALARALRTGLGPDEMGRLRGRIERELATA